MSIRKACATPGCTNIFSPAAPDLLVCNDCRRSILILEAPRPAREASNKEALATTHYWWAHGREFWDYLIYDESGRLQWASDLRQRYWRETIPRGLWR